MRVAHKPQQEQRERIEAQSRRNQVARATAAEVHAGFTRALGS